MTTSYSFNDVTGGFTESGFSFGELALINKDCIRNASIVTDETTDLLVLERDVYDRCLKSAQSADLQEK